MKTILLTAFEPFGGDPVNPTQMVLERFPDVIGGCAVAKLLLPVEFVRARELAFAEYDRLQPDAVVMLGLAASRDAVTPETEGHNVMNARIPDNAGFQPKGLPVVEGGPETLPCTFPVERIVSAVSALGIPARASYSAGEYVCNTLLYGMLAHNNGAVPTGFIHVPAVPELAQEGHPFLLFDDIYKGITAAVETVAASLED